MSIDKEKLKALAESAKEQREEWEAAGKPWPIWNTRMYEMHSAATPETILTLIAENDALRKALTYIRDTTDDWHVAEKAADALADTKDRP